MSGNVGERHWEDTLGRLREVVRGTKDPRIRATWRFFLAIPLIMGTEFVALTVTPALGSTGMLPTGLVQAGVFAVLLVGWAQFIDRRRLVDYGLLVSGSWLLDLAIAFGAVVLAHGAWYALGTALGWTTVTVAMSTPGESLALGLGAVFVAVAVNVWVQDTVFFGVVLRSAAEGFHARNVLSRRAVIAGWLVGILFVVGIHSGSLQRLPGLTVAGALFGLLYVHTGELALPVGFHLGVNFSGGWLFAPASLVGERAAVFAVTETLPVLEGVSSLRIPQMVLAYLLVVWWLKWRQGELSIERGIARWTAR